MSENNKTNLEEKLNALEMRNSQLEANLSLIAARNTALYPDSEATDEIDLKELWGAIWQGKWIIISVTFIFSVASVFYALSMPNEYKSTAILTPANQSGAGGLSKLAGQFGGLASFAGINLGDGGAEGKSIIAMEIIKTWGFLEQFIEDNNIQVEVFAVKGWNRATNELIVDPDIYDVENKKWIREFDSSKEQKAMPSSWELFEEFKERVKVSQDKKSGLITLSVEYFSPLLAKEWVDSLIKAINFHLQKQDRDEAIKSIVYLNKKIKETNIAEMQSVFYQLIEEQTKTLMLAEVSEEYVFKTLSEAKVPEKRSKPNRVLIIILSFSFGGTLSVMFLFFKNFISVKNR